MVTEAGGLRRFLRDLGRPWSANRTRRRHPLLWLGWVGRQVSGLAEAMARVRRWLQGATRQRLRAGQAFRGVGQNHWSAHFLR